MRQIADIKTITQDIDNVQHTYYKIDERTIKTKRVDLKLLYRCDDHERLAVKLLVNENNFHQIDLRTLQSDQITRLFHSFLHTTIRLRFGGLSESTLCLPNRLRRLSANCFFYFLFIYLYVWHC